ncbi:hypothetical protein BASA62_005159 [Batrachochytrium salamandrivorans]|nr:hypothetical protein BASA62_005159 [Batrachochytrium salamandrivorans]
MQPTESVKSNPAAMELPISHKAILDIQKFAPAPSQTLYQLVVLPKSTLPLSANVESTAYHKWGSSPSVGMSSLTALEHSKNKDIALAATSAPCYGRVVLRDWPRRRMSQSWSRNGMLNPSEKVLSYKEFLDGDLKDELIHIFGQEQYQNIVQTVQGLANTDSK